MFSVSVALSLFRNFITRANPDVRLAIISVAANPVEKHSNMSIPGKGGMTPYIREVGKHLSNEGFNVTIFTRSESRDDVGIVVITPSLRVHYLVAGPQYHLPHDQKYHHLDNFTAQIMPSEFDAVFTNYWLGGLVGLKLGLPQIHVHHSLATLKFQWEPMTYIGNIRLEAEQEINQKVDCIVHQLKSEDKLTNSTRWVHITPGIDPAMFQGLRKQTSQDKLSFNQNVINVLYVGRFVPEKGIQFALEALSRSQAPFKFRLIGAHKNSQLEHLVQEYPQFEFLGPKPRAEVAEFMSASDILVVPSLYETFGLVILEGMAAGCALLVTAVGGSNKMVVDGVNGFKVPPADTCALLEAFEKLSRNKTMIHNMGQKNREIGLQNSWKATAEKFGRKIRDILRKQKLSGFMDLISVPKLMLRYVTFKS